MSTQSKVNAKPSDSINNEDILRAKAAASNKRRAQRRAQQEREDRIKEEQARRDQEEQMCKEKEKSTKSKSDKKIKQGKIKTRVDGVEFDSLAKSMAHIDPILWGRENDYRTSCWIKINRALKRDGVCVYGGHTYELI